MNTLPSSAHETMPLSNSLANVFRHSSGYLRIEWHIVSMVSSEVRGLFGQILQLLRDERLHRLFTERTTAPPLSTDDSHWMVWEWIPQAMREAGLTHCAVVESSEHIGARFLHSAELNGKASKIHFRFFDSFAQGETWIREAA
jgi:hypothetical protein